MDTVNMTADETFLVVIISALIFAFVSIGIACFVTYLVLNKYNNLIINLNPHQLKNIIIHFQMLPAIMIEKF